MAQITDIFIDQGSDWSAILTFNNTDGTPRDFTGCTVSGQMRKGYGSTTYTAITTTFIAPNSSGKIILEYLWILTRDPLVEGTPAFDTMQTYLHSVIASKVPSYDLSLMLVTR